MLQSMTGFGAGKAQVGAEELSVEIKSVNHKFCEVKVRTPRELAQLESLASRQVKDALARGAVDVSIRRVRAAGPGLVPQVDVALAREYRRVFSELAAALGAKDEVSLRDVSLQPNVIRLEEPGVDEAAATQAMKEALLAALEALKTMRATEGAAIAQDLSSRLDLVAAVVGEIKTLSPEAVRLHRDRLAERVAELAQGIEVDPQRLAVEVAILADRTDVAEELTRLESHLGQFRALISSDEPSGRKMDFLVQEMHREVNTTGSKSQHADITQRVVLLKAELERVREQVQNVE